VTRRIGKSRPKFKKVAETVAKSKYFQTNHVFPKKTLPGPLKSCLNGKILPNLVTLVRTDKILLGGVDRQVARQIGRLGCKSSKLLENPIVPKGLLLKTK
jgi:hypothetical protein